MIAVAVAATIGLAPLALLEGPSAVAASYTVEFAQPLGQPRPRDE